MPVYTYRRADGTTFDYRQKFTDDPLKVDPTTGQPVQRIVHAAGIIFKGSGFYVNDSKDASRKNVTTPAKIGEDSPAKATETPAAEKLEKSEKSEKKEAAPAKADVSAAAD